MTFSTVNQKRPPHTCVYAVRFAITSTPTSHNGRLTIPSTMLKQLGWEPQTCLEVLAGDEADTGWYGLRPSTSETKYRARLRVSANGVGRFNSKALVPSCLTGLMHTIEPETKTIGDTLYVKIF